MYINPVCFVLLPVLVVLTSAFPFAPGHCNCGLGSGEDICHHSHKGHKCTPLVVRPMEIPKPSILPAPPKVVCAPVGGGLPPLVPVGGPCACHTSLVKPAVVPKPACLAHGARIDVSHDHQLTMSQKQHILFGGSGCGHNHAILTTPDARPIVVDEILDTHHGNPANYVPADPVSLSVAYKLAQEACEHNEDRLAFGFRKLPKDVPLYTKRRVNHIQEENLFNINGQIVELKKTHKCNKAKSVDEEAAEQLLALADDEAQAEEDERIASNHFKRITLGEIGYGPANIKGATFINVPAGHTDALDGLVSKPCNDGFQPGNVVITQVPKIDVYSLPKPLPEPCPSEHESFLPPPPAIPSGAVFTSPYTYLSSASSHSASSANRYSQSVILQKLEGCHH